MGAGGSAEVTVSSHYLASRTTARGVPVRPGDPRAEKKRRSLAYLEYGIEKAGDVGSRMRRSVVGFGPNKRAKIGKYVRPEEIEVKPERLDTSQAALAPSLAGSVARTSAAAPGGRSRKAKFVAGGVGAVELNEATVKAVMEDPKEAARKRKAELKAKAQEQAKAEEPYKPPPKKGRIRQSIMFLGAVLRRDSRDPPEEAPDKGSRRERKKAARGAGAFDADP